MRNPNGYGSVVKLSGNRRKPFCARKTLGLDDRGYPIYKAIGYYAGHDEALLALAEYNRTPYDIDGAKITVKEVYDKWSKIAFAKIPESTMKAHKATISKFEDLYDVPYKDLKKQHMQGIIDGGYGYSVQGHIRSLFSALDKYALEYDIISKGYSVLLTTEPVPDTGKTPFLNAEMKTVWSFKDEPYVDTILILLYTGFRIRELLNLKVQDIDLVEGLMKGGSKSQAGKNRIVPIHPVIHDLVKKRMDKSEGMEFLINIKGKQMTPFLYYEFWNTFLEYSGLDHTPHECRHTFRSRLDSAGANKVCIDLMMGHKSAGTGERIYTHKTILELIEAMNMLPW